MVGYNLFPDLNNTGKTRQNFFVSGSGSAGTYALQLKYWDAINKTAPTLYDPAELPGAQFTELGLFNNAFYFSGQPNHISSCTVWTT